MATTLDECCSEVAEWLNGSRKSHVNPDLDPVLLVPGIGGSILTAVDENGHRERVWVRFFDAERKFRRKLWSRFDPSTGKTVSLDTKTRIEVPESRYGLYSLDILDPDVIIPLNVVYYFHVMIKKMVASGYEEGTTLFGFGYDFRQSNRLQETLERLREKLEFIHKTSGGKKVNIVSHSMGGLLVKCFLSLYSEDFEKYVNTWVAIGTPFKGAPGLSLAGLLTGISLANHEWQEDLFISKWCIHQLFVECPSIYELMACPDFQWPPLPVLEIWREKKDGCGQSSVEVESYGVQDSISVIKEALANNSTTYGGNRIALPFNSEIWKWANETRRIMSLAKIPPSVKFYNIYGTGKGTPFAVRYGSKHKPILELEQVLHSKAEYVSFIEGDGTVPMESAMADGLAAKERIGLPADHRGLVSDKRVLSLLKHWFRNEDPDPLYDPVIVPREVDLVENEESLSKSIEEDWEIMSEDTEEIRSR